MYVLTNNYQSKSFALLFVVVIGKTSKAMRSLKTEGRLIVSNNSTNHREDFILVD